MMSDCDVYLRNSEIYLNRFICRRMYRYWIRINPRLRRQLFDYRQIEDTSEKNEACVRILNSLEGSFIWRLEKWINCFYEDLSLYRSFHNQRTRIDNSDPCQKDYYSVVVVLKNEARYIKEYILFYKATGAERIYIYDNESTDNLMDEIDPFVKSGFVVYQKWPGEIVQTAAYRDAIRRYKKRTKWLAIVDSDEFLFSPQGDMRIQLKTYEEYPGIGANWKMFGPNGHDKSPDGLVIENYTTTIANDDDPINRHIKSIVQPDKVFLIDHTHYPIYKGNKYAVDENKNSIDNNYALAPSAGKAFTRKSGGRVFRINHYSTKSLEDLHRKCERGYCDGSPNRDINDALRPFELPLKEDRLICQYVDAIKSSGGVI